MGTEGFKNDRCAFTGSEENHLSSGRVIRHEGFVVGLTDLDHSVSNIFGSGFLNLVYSHVYVGEVNSRHGEGRVHSKSGELLHIFPDAD